MNKLWLESGIRRFAAMLRVRKKDSLWHPLELSS